MYRSRSNHHVGSSYQSKEKGRLVCLEQSLRIKGLWSRNCGILREESGRSAQLFDELFQRQR